MIGLCTFVFIGRALTSIAASMAMLAVPVAGVLLSVLILREPIGSANAAGLGLIVASVATTSLGERRRAPTPANSGLRPAQAPRHAVAGASCLRSQTNDC